MLDVRKNIQQSTFCAALGHGFSNRISGRGHAFLLLLLHNIFCASIERLEIRVSVNNNNNKRVWQNSFDSKSAGLWRSQKGRRSDNKCNVTTPWRTVPHIKRTLRVSEGGPFKLGSPFVCCPAALDRQSFRFCPTMSFIDYKLIFSALGRPYYFATYTVSSCLYLVLTTPLLPLIKLSNAC